MPKMYQQPSYRGGKMVKASDVPKNYYSIYIPECDANNPEDVKFLQHDNDPCITRDEMADLYNHFATKKEVLKALSIIKKAMK